jgi:SAM-dependent methyltransferase
MNILEPKGRFATVNDFHYGLLSRNSEGTLPHHYLCGWSSAESQQSRFAALLRAVSFQGGSVVDYGCGTGDLFPYLAKQGYPFRYLGLDMNREMIRVAQQSCVGEFRLIVADQVDFTTVDYVFASGIFQFVDNSEPQYYYRLVQALFAKCRSGIAANFLSALRDDSEKHADELYLRPQNVVDMASSISGRWALDHSYHPGRGDMTVGILAATDATQWKRPKL